MKLKIKKSLWNNVIIKILKEESQQMKGNIFIPDQEEKTAKIGEIISIGPGYWTVLGEKIATELEVGDIVVLPNFSGQNFKLNGEEYVIIKENDILISLEEEN